MKKILSLVLALALVFGLSAAALADGGKIGVAMPTQDFSQCAHREKKQSFWSVGRPEIPKNFRPAQLFFLRVEKPPGFFNALKGLSR